MSKEKLSIRLKKLKSQKARLQVSKICNFNTWLWSCRRLKKSLTGELKTGVKGEVIPHCKIGEVGQRPYKGVILLTEKIG